MVDINITMTTLVLGQSAHLSTSATPKLFTTIYLHMMRASRASRALLRALLVMYITALAGLVLVDLMGQSCSDLLYTWSR